MYKVLVFVLVAMMAVAVFSAPADDQDMVRMEDGSVRMQRITCDLMSGLGVGDSACAAHCLLLGFRGGWCERGVCHCRW